MKRTIKFTLDDLAVVTQVILAITLFIGFFAIVGKAMMEDSDKWHARYLKATHGVPQVNIPN